MFLPEALIQQGTVLLDGSNSVNSFSTEQANRKSAVEGFIVSGLLWVSLANAVQ